MIEFLTRRMIGLVIVLWAMSAIVFALQAIIPADPARALAGPAAPPETVAAVREQMGLNGPILVQYVDFMAGVVRGDLGTSVRTRQPVADDIARYLPASLELVAAALFLGITMAVGFAFVQTGTFGSAPVRLTMLALGSVPIFLSALLLIYVFWFKLDIFPGSGRIGIRRFSGPTGFMLIDTLLAGRPGGFLSALHHLVLPALALAFPVAVSVGRSLAGALSDRLNQPWIRTARGKGLSEHTVIARHGLRNAAGPPLSMVGLQIGLMFGNLLIVERIFAWPGLGLYLVQSFASSDLAAVLGVALVFGAFYILAVLMLDILQSLADPRIGL